MNNTDSDQNEVRFAKVFDEIGTMVRRLNLPDSIFKKSKEIWIDLSKDLIPDMIMGSNSRLIWAKSGRYPEAMINVPWGNELFVHDGFKSLSALSLRYVAVDVARRAKMVLCDRRDFVSAVKDPCLPPESVENDVDDALCVEHWKIDMTGPMPWENLLKELNRECVNGKNRMYAMIYLAYREEADYSSALDLRNFEAVFPTVTQGNFDPEGDVCIFRKPVLGCIEAEFCNQRLCLQHVLRF